MKRISLILFPITLILLNFNCKKDSIEFEEINLSKNTFIMIHCEAGYRSAKLNDLPCDNFPEEYRIMDLGWQEYFWPSLSDLVNTADSFNFKLTIAFNPQWVEYMLKDTNMIVLVNSWIANGHEIGFHHHPYNHPDWNGYSNEAEAQNDSLYLGTVNEGFTIIKNVFPEYDIVSSTMGNLPLDFPSLMRLSDEKHLCFGNGNQYNSYPQLGQVISLIPNIRYQAETGTIVELAIREFSTVMNISLADAFPILKEQYQNTQGNEVFGIVWHEFDYFRAKDQYVAWFSFLKNQDANVKTMREISELYIE